MSMSFRRDLVRDAVGISAMNAVINGCYIWWLRRLSPPWGVAGTDGVAPDLAATPIWLAMLTTLLGTGAVQRKLWEGRFREPESVIPAVLWLLPYRLALRAAVFGAVAAILLSLPLWTVLQTQASATLPLGYAIATKVALTVLFSAAIVPLVVLAALADMVSRPIAPNAHALGQPL